MDATTADVATLQIPRPRDGERYAGLMLDADGKPSHHLFLLEVEPDKRMTWAEAQEWAKNLGTGIGVPTRFESALLMANLRSQFDLSAWYWTSTQYAEYYAWLQYFDYGLQFFSDISWQARCRAVRRLSV